MGKAPEGIQAILSLEAYEDSLVKKQ
jgi:hypothetical protein